MPDLKKLKADLSTRNLVVLAMFVSLSYVVSLFEFPIFPAAPYLKLDFGNVLLLLSGFIFGPIAGILACIAKELLDHSYTVVYLTSVKLFDILEANKFDREISRIEKDTSLSYILGSDLLIIDDLGTELNNSFTSSQLYHCIDTRLTHRHSTIISTNLSFDDLREHYSERIFSRITSNYNMYKITGPDIRMYRKTTSNRK